MRADKVSFLHFRHVLPWDDKLQPTGGLTVAYTINDDFTEIKFSVACCSEKDHYNKKIGNAVSSGRFTKGFYGYYTRVDAATWFDRFEKFIQEVYTTADGCDLANTSRAKGK
jgi:hypothetical protein